jgi:transcriptional regulator GlxA family with amidase domain
MHALTLAAPAALDSVAFQLVRDLAAALAAGNASQQEAVFQTSRALCSHLLSGYPADVPEASLARVALSPWQERLAKQTMLQQMERGLAIADVARQCSLSRSHFSRAFKKTTGLAPRDWFLQARLERAKALLSQSPASISQISLECGFADQSHFTRVFTRSIGTTPFTWRRAASA